IVTGSTPSKDNAEYYGDDFPFYKPTDLNNGYYVEAASDNVSPKGFEISRQLPSGSVLVTCIGATIGKTGLIRKKGICNQQINAILPSQKFISEFIYFYCISPKVQNFIKTNASSTTLPILNKANFSKLPIPLPPLATQNQIVQILESKFAHLEKLEQFVNASLENLQRLKSSLLNQAFKGELV
ncbi:restriction endonuclease subunit S, partial [Helicobacter japonicus]